MLENNDGGMEEDSIYAYKNKSLKEKQETLSRERATMVQKNEEVRARVEAMIVRLKSMEQGN